MTVRKKGYIVISTVISKSSSVFPTNDFSRISAAKRLLMMFPMRFDLKITDLR